MQRVDGVANAPEVYAEKQANHRNFQYFEIHQYKPQFKHWVLNFNIFGSYVDNFFRLERIFYSDDIGRGSEPVFLQIFLPKCRLAGKNRTQKIKLCCRKAFR